MKRSSSQKIKSVLTIGGALGFCFSIMIGCGGNDTTAAEGNNGAMSSDTLPPAVDTTAYAVPDTAPAGSVLGHIQQPSPWVDSVFNSLSEDEKIAQLFTVAIYPYKKDNEAKITKLLKQQAIGGLIVMKGGPRIAAQLLNKYQSMSRVPLLVATDAEWGVKMRMDSVVRYPYQLSLGAMASDELVYEMGQQIAMQHQRIGIHVNFAPVVDINNNPNNPVIGMRSFGEDKINVTNKGWAYICGLQDNRVLAIAKHFPGHGDTDVDSHLDLPLISHDMNRLTDVELYPFQTLIDSGLGGLMTTHLYVPAIDSTKNLAAGLSQPAVTGILREKMGFNGLIYTDALNMKGVTKHFPNGEIDVKALLAGNDMMLMSEDINTSIAAVKKAIDEGVITWEMIDQKVKRILAVKEWAGLDNYLPVNPNGIHKDLNSPEADDLNQRIANAYLTLLKGKNALPLKKEEGQKIALVTLGGNSSTTFRGLIENHYGAKHFYIAKGASTSKATALKSQLQDYDVVIVAMHANGFRPKNNYGMSEAMRKAVEVTAEHPNTILCLFSDAYSLGKLKGLEGHENLMLAYQNTTFSAHAMFNALSGKITPTGALPVTVNEQFKVGMRAE